MNIINLSYVTIRCNDVCGFLQWVELFLVEIFHMLVEIVKCSRVAMGTQTLESSVGWEASPGQCGTAATEIFACAEYSTPHKSLVPATLIQSPDLQTSRVFCGYKEAARVHFLLFFCFFWTAFTQWPSHTELKVLDTLTWQLAYSSPCHPSQWTNRLQEHPPVSRSA